MKKIQLASHPIVKDHLTVYQEKGPAVDLTMDLKALSFRPGTLEQIFTYQILNHFFEEELLVALKNWYECLAPGGKLYIVVDDFEYVCRAFMGGDITIDILNKHHCTPVFIDREFAGRLAIKAGFPEPKVKVWFGEVPGLYKAQHYELIIEAEK